MTRARDLAAGTFEQATGGVLKLETSDTTVTDGSVLGKIEFKAPDEASGTDAILVGAAIEAVAEGTFAADNNATELVFKTGASAAADAKMTLTSGGELLVGTTSSDDSTDGFKVKSSGQKLTVTRSGAEPLVLNRRTSDGDIVKFRKDNAAVGSIGVGQSSDLYIGTSDTGILTSSSESITPWNPSTNVGRDDAIDLGTSDHRFQDLYLSGGVYLGGTGSANLLSDYEIGTWTPTQGNFSTWTSPTFSAVYTKIGRMVFINLRQSGGTIGWTAGQQMGGLPFAPLQGASGYATDGGPTSDNGAILIWTASNVYFQKGNASETSLVFSAMYYTSA